MSRIIHARHKDWPSRPGFSLIELLVVIGIIAVLLTLSAAAAFRFLGTQNVANTRTVIQRTGSRLRQQTAYANDLARNRMPVPAAVTSLAGGDPDRAMVIHQKFVSLQWFPTTFAEAVNGPAGLTPGVPAAASYPAKPAYVKYLSLYNITPQTNPPPTNPPGTPPLAYESAACLYMILQHGNETAGDSDLGLTSATKSMDPSTLIPPAVTTSEVNQLNKNQLPIPVLVDNWGRPLVFSRWPTGNLTAGGGNTGTSPVNPSGAVAGFNDPLDPRGLLSGSTWYASANRRSFEAALHPLPKRAGANQAAVTLNLTPVVVSWGTDGKPGLTFNTTVNPTSKIVVNPTTLQYGTQVDSNDNLYSSLLP